MGNTNPWGMNMWRRGQWGRQIPGEWASVEKQGSVRNVCLWEMNINVEAEVNGE